VKFLSAGDAGSITIFGVPFDATASFKPGARFAPDGVRFYSESLETFSLHLGKSLEDLKVADAGNLPVFTVPEEMVTAVEEFVKNVELPVAIGGEHSITYPVVKALLERYTNLAVVQFDAHADLRNTYNRTPYSHACVMRRLHELDCTIIQVGVRSATREELEFIAKSERIIRLESLAELYSTVASMKMPIYVTVDIDFFDPSFAPGTGNPEPCGFSPKEFFSVIYSLPQVEVVGFDVVEINPTCDPSGITQVLGARIIRDLIIKFWG